MIYLKTVGVTSAFLINNLFNWIQLSIGLTTERTFWLLSPDTSLGCHVWTGFPLIWIRLRWLTPPTTREGADPVLSVDLTTLICSPFGISSSWYLLLLGFMVDTAWSWFSWSLMKDLTLWLVSNSWLSPDREWSRDLQKNESSIASIQVCASIGKLHIYWLSEMKTEIWTMYLHLPHMNYFSVSVYILK